MEAGGNLKELAETPEHLDIWCPLSCFKPTQLSLWDPNLTWIPYSGAEMGQLAVSLIQEGQSFSRYQANTLKEMTATTHPS